MSADVITSLTARPRKKKHYTVKDLHCLPVDMV